MIEPDPYEEWVDEMAYRRMEREARPRTASDPPPVRVLQPRSVPTGRPVMGPVASAVFGVVSGFALVAFFIASSWLISRLARRYLT